VVVDVSGYRCWLLVMVFFDVLFLVKLVNVSSGGLPFEVGKGYNLGGE